MPGGGTEVAVQATKGYLDLGVVGAALFIIVLFVVLFMWLNNKMINRLIGKATNTEKVDKLCDKIDTLVTVIHTQQTSSYKDMKTIQDLMNRQLDCTLDIQRRVVRIDDRTYTCRGNPEKKDGGENT